VIEAEAGTDDDHRSDWTSSPLEAS
jgi:hypothetical protein